MGKKASKHKREKKKTVNAHTKNTRETKLVSRMIQKHPLKKKQK